MDDIVMVPVPVKLLPRVYRVLSEPWGESDPLTSEQKFLAKLFKNARDEVRQFLLHLADSPGSWVTFNDIAPDKAARVKLQGTLRSLTIACRKLGRNEWPFEVEKVGGRVRYRMGKEGAETLKQLTM